MTVDSGAGLLVIDASRPERTAYTVESVAEAASLCRSNDLTGVLLALAGDEVRPAAVTAMAALLEGSDVVYADEDWLDAAGRRVRPYHKPRWSPDRLRSQMYLTGVVGYRTESWPGSTVPDIDPALSLHEQLYALALWATDRTERVSHLPVVACHRRIHPAYGTGLLPHLERSFAKAGMQAQPTIDTASGVVTWQPTKANPSMASIVIPTGGSGRVVGGRRLLLVDNAVRSIIGRSSLGRFTQGVYEIIIVIDRDTDPGLAADLVAIDPARVRFVRDDRPFNFAAAVNLGASKADGEVIILLNDDTEIVTPNWIERLSCLALADGVGAVGVRLDYGDGRLQHAGVTGRHGSADHRYRGYPIDATGHGDELLLTHNVLAVTAACLAVSREHWTAFGGMDEAFPLNYNDLDLCLRFYQAGLRNVQDNRTVLNHLETSSRVAGSESWEDERMRSRWSHYLHDDPYDNPCLVPIGFSGVAAPGALNRLREHTGWEPNPRFGPRGDRLRFPA